MNGIECGEEVDGKGQGTGQAARKSCTQLRQSPWESSGEPLSKIAAQRTQTVVGRRCRVLEMPRVRGVVGTKELYLRRVRTTRGDRLSVGAVTACASSMHIVGTTTAVAKGRHARM